MPVEYIRNYSFTDLQKYQEQTGCGLIEADAHFRKLALDNILERCKTVEDIKECLKEAQK